jgi:hypothetical protein
MGTPEPHYLATYIVGGLSSNSPVTTYTCSSGGTASLIITTVAISPAAGAVGVFLPTTTTAALRGHFFHLQGASGSGVATYKPMPTAPVAGDQCRVWVPGSNRSSTQAYGLTLGGVQPERSAVAGANITGISISQAAPLLGAGTLTVTFTASTKKLKLKMGTAEYGAELDISAASGTGYVYDAAATGFIKVTWTGSSLPTTDQTDTWTLAAPLGTLGPDYEGPETHSVTGGKVRYRTLYAANTHDLNSMVGMTVYPAAPAGTATTVATGSSLGLTAGSFTATNASDWPTAGFWIWNSRGDCRYVESRSGNTLTCLACNWVTLTGNGTEAAAIGATITGGTSGATAVVVASRAGQAICKNLTGTFQVGETAGAVGTLSAVVRGFRGYTAVSWAAGDAIVPMPYVDMALDSGTIETVTSETQIPAGLTFTTPTSASRLALGTFAPNSGAAYCVSEWIPDGAVAVEEIIIDPRYGWS